MICTKPPMGWNSWNTFGENISDEIIRQMTDSMVETGLLAAGYDTLVIDDCWAERQRDAEHRMVPSREKFPHGIKAVSDYVHGKGLKFGMYSCVGNRTCANYPGSLEHEFIDAETLAEWGVDYLKYDYCYKPVDEPGKRLYRRMGLALANCGRDSRFSACSWGIDGTPEWIKTTGAHMWRSTGDINDSWASIKNLAQMQVDLQPYNGQGCFNDMDMLVVGMNGKGNVALTGCTKEEYRTHFSLWALLNSPLIVGCDVRNLSAEAREILLNEEVIAVNQDPAGRQPYLADDNRDRMIWVKVLEGGDLALGFFNMDDAPCGFFLPFVSLGIGRASGKALALRDLWSHQDIGVFENEYQSGVVEPHSCIMLRARLVEAR